VSTGVNNFVAHAQQERTNPFQIGRFSADPENEFRIRSRGRGTSHRRIDKTSLPRRGAAAIFFENDGLTELQSTQSALGLR